jgi:ArsR family transcriptional regulator
MKNQSPKLALFAQFAELAKTLGHAHRLDLLEHVAQGERSVETLAQRTRLSIANASQHLQQLRRVGLVSARREGKFIYYRLADNAVLDLLASLHRIGERNVAEVKRILQTYFRDRDSLEPISRKELQRRLREHSVTVLDVRPEDEFVLGHVPGALNIPLAALKKRLSELNASMEIIAYCRGPYCVLSFEAVALLRERGFNVRRLQDGLPEWRAAGLPVVTGTGHSRS